MSSMLAGRGNIHVGQTTAAQLHIRSRYPKILTSERGASHELLLVLHSSCLVYVRTDTLDADIAVM